MLPSLLAEVRLMHHDSRKDPLARITATRWTELSPCADVKHWATLASFLLSALREATSMSDKWLGSYCPLLAGSISYTDGTILTAHEHIS